MSKPDYGQPAKRVSKFKEMSIRARMVCVTKASEDATATLRLATLSERAYSWRCPYSIQLSDCKP